MRSVRWFLIASLVGILAGSASALFLFCLDSVTQFREIHRWLIFTLPLGGLAIGALYFLWGRNVEAGNNLIFDEIFESKSAVPARMAPLIFIGTVATHLFGGSAGREGTAIQMGASLADQLRKPLRLAGADRERLLIAGLSAGFASVFGTPLAGIIFGLEVLTIGRLRTDALFPAVVAAVVGHQVCLAWGIHHAVYSVGGVPQFSLPLFCSVIVAGLAFGVVARGFTMLIHKLSRWAELYIKQPYLRPFFGGLVFVLAFSWPAMHRYTGLGLPEIQNAFKQLIPPQDFAVKLLATAVTLGSGFKGGEVTPLFYIGATLGNALSHWLPVAFPVLAGLGFVAVFAGAANVPIASTLLAMELFGAPMGWLAAVACVISFLISGPKGIYRSQRGAKSGAPNENLKLL